MKSTQKGHKRDEMRPKLRMGVEESHEPDLSVERWLF